MRMRTTAAVAVGTLALTALVVPAAQADGGYGDTAITKVTVNGGKNVVLGVSEVKKFTVSVTARDNSGIKGADISVHGPGFGYMSSTTKCSGSTCSATFTVDPKADLMYSNDYAGTWYVDAWVDAGDGDYIWKEKAASFKFQRASRQTVNASPEPVKKGKTITVTGWLSRANWDDFKYHGYTSQSVKLQFRKKGSSTYTTVKTVKTNNKGDAKTTVKATVDGYWRYTFAGTSTTPAATATGDYVDVK
ncbi:calcium-binding protein [Streptomyces sp. NPDC057521]|uniref:calcium-binding protein n=1 Tax=Streptomyces sp. NPDC057521 TaxID=3346156 RepID=UPI0036866409